MPDYIQARPTTACVMEALDDVVDPCSIATGVPIGLVAMGLVRDVSFDQKGCVVSLRVTSPLCMQIPMIMDAVAKRLGQLENIGEVKCFIDRTLDWEPSMMTKSAQARLRKLRPLPTPP